MDRKGPRRNAAKERFWRATIGRQQRSGQSVRSFCRQHKLSEPSFYAWRRELQRRGTGAQAVRKTLGSDEVNVVRCDRQIAQPKSSRPKNDGARFVPVRLAAGNDSLLANAPSLGLGSIEVLLPSGVLLRLPAGIEPGYVAALLAAWEQSRC